MPGHELYAAKVTKPRHLPKDIVHEIRSMKGATGDRVDEGLLTPNKAVDVEVGNVKELDAAQNANANTAEGTSSSESNYKQDKLWEVRESPGKGLGVFATKDIKRGTRILTETPLLHIPNAVYLTADIERAYAKLSSADREKFWALHSAHGQDPSQWPTKGAHPTVNALERKRIEQQHAARVGVQPTLQSIFQTNCISAGRGAAVFLDGSRFNHSCTPNATFDWNESLSALTVHACAAIPAGAEISLTYCRPALPRRYRAWQLRHYGFACACDACREPVVPGSSAEASERRRSRVFEVVEGFGDEEDHARSVEAARPERLREYVELAGLLREEGLFDMELGETYFDIAFISQKAGDHRNAYAAALKGFEVLVDCAGWDSPATAWAVQTLDGMRKRLKEAMEGKDE